MKHLLVLFSAAAVLAGGCSSSDPFNSRPLVPPPGTGCFTPPPGPDVRSDPNLYYPGAAPAAPNGSAAPNRLDATGNAPDGRQGSQWQPSESSVVSAEHSVVVSRAGDRSSVQRASGTAPSNDKVKPAAFESATADEGKAPKEPPLRITESKSPAAATFVDVGGARKGADSAASQPSRPSTPKKLTEITDLPKANSASPPTRANAEWTPTRSR